MSFDYTRGSSTSVAIPSVRQLAVSGSGNNTWLKGAPLILSSGTFVEAGADPATIGGIALHDVGAGTGRLYPTGRKEFPPNFAQAVQLEDFQTWTALFLGTLPTTIGSSYGITKDTDNKWKVDFAKTGGSARGVLVDLAPTTTPPGAVGASSTGSTSQLIPRVGFVFSSSNLTISRI